MNMEKIERMFDALYAIIFWNVILSCLTLGLCVLAVLLVSKIQEKQIYESIKNTEEETKEIDEPKALQNKIRKLEERVKFLENMHPLLYRLSESNGNTKENTNEND